MDKIEQQTHHQFSYYYWE